MRLNRKLAGALAIAGAVAVLAPGAPAEAQGVGAVAVVGDGTISPGLTPNPTAGTVQNVTFTGTAAGAFVNGVPDADVGSMSCAFSGTSGGLFAQESSLVGTGTVSGGCSGTGVAGSTVTVSCTFDYFRLGPAVTITGSCTATVDGVTFTATAGGAFVFVPTTVSPTTSYVLVGATAGVAL